MNEISLKLYDQNSHTLAASEPGAFVNLSVTREYEPGDRIGLEVDHPGVFCEIRFDDTMLPAVIYLGERAVSFPVPFGEQKLVYSPKSFAGEKHLVSARLLDEKEALTRRNLALNPYDFHDASGVYPHASANVETRGEMVFAARNTIDGIFANRSHGEYPCHSWGINRRADAEITVDLGVLCEVDEVRITTRADFPHDNYWTQGTLVFSDGSEQVVDLGKHLEPQVFPVEVETRTVTLKDLKMAEGPSPFPALTQLEVWGKPLSIEN